MPEASGPHSRFETEAFRATAASELEAGPY